MTLLNGKIVSDLETQKLIKKVSKLKIKPKLGIVQVGNLPESNRYINNKIKKAKEIGIETNLIKFDESIKEIDLIDKIKNLNNNFDGLIVQLPLPNHLNKKKVLDSIDCKKDIDCCTTKNADKFYNDEIIFIPPTANAILLLLNHYEIDLKDKRILIIGESDLVGKPTKKLLSKFSKYVDSTNKEKGISNSNKYDILIVAAGSPHLIKKENVKKDAIVVDVGITVINKKMYGDVDFEDVKNKVIAISPVPGGVGPLTVICLIKNLVESLI
ncbi:MAG: bifunctional 5,10-methylenetetrahydrofolate dehydrogenase/5,10-methenyltetrahydrofolate cyclohydrolase [Mycoplasma sp.]|nr:bifunctional 5,10-methylenetetrahydrofolate dehydrogenase/5,10-methenyltetrahydrofolate cyclohydrolase [Mycoplasma sp.]